MLSINEIKAKRLPDFDKSILDDPTNMKADDARIMHTTIIDHPSLNVSKARIEKAMSKANFSPLKMGDDSKVSKLFDDDKKFDVFGKELFSKKAEKKISRFF